MLKFFKPNNYHNFRLELIDPLKQCGWDYQRHEWKEWSEVPESWRQIELKDWDYSSPLNKLEN